MDDSLAVLGQVVNEFLMTKILYIAGYGRSGSTILDIILGNHEKIVGVGEVGFLLKDCKHGRLCSCGQPYEACEFWKGLLDDHLPVNYLESLVHKIERTSNIPWLCTGFIKDEDRRAYRDYQERLFDYVNNRAGKSIIVDSSKSARDKVGRFLALRKIANQDVYVLHLVRNGLATLESLTMTGSNWAIEGHIDNLKWPALRAAVGWVSANVWVSVLRRFLGANRYMLLRYEDFISDPVTAVYKIGAFLDIDVEGLVQQINNDAHFQVGHQTGGNRVRLQGAIKLRKPNTQHNGPQLKLRQRLIFTLFAGWLNRLYGYS